MAKQQLVARIKRSSKYHHQSPTEVWFVVEIDGGGGHPIGATVAGGAVEVATGKTIQTEVFGLRLREDA